jgi:hypothetical protein
LAEIGSKKRLTHDKLLNRIDKILNNGCEIKPYQIRSENKVNRVNPEIQSDEIRYELNNNEWKHFVE